MSKKRLLIMRGVPGTGKSTIAEALVRSGLYDCISEADMYFKDFHTGEYKFDGSKLKEAHDNCFSYAAYCMSKGYNVIVSNTNLEPWEFEKYKNLADSSGYAITEMILKSQDFKSVHDIPKEKIKEMQDRFYDSLVDEFLDYVGGEF